MCFSDVLSILTSALDGVYFWSSPKIICSIFHKAGVLLTGPKCLCGILCFWLVGPHLLHKILPQNFCIYRNSNSAKEFNYKFKVYSLENIKRDWDSSCYKGLYLWFFPWADIGWESQHNEFWVKVENLLVTSCSPWNGKYIIFRKTVPATNI